MSDKEQWQNPFQGQYHQYTMSLRMPVEDTLTITVENTQTLTRHKLTVNPEYISCKDTFFQGVFERPFDLYFFLKTQFDHIILREGSITFNYEYGMNRSKIINIYPTMEEIDPVEFEHLKTDKMRKDFTAQLLQKDSEIQELKQKYEEIVQRHSAELEVNQLIKDQEQWQATFKGQYQQYTMSLRMPVEDLVTITVENKWTLARYSMAFNSESLSLSTNFFHDAYKSPFDLYFFLKTQFDRIILGEGSITFNCEYGNNESRIVNLYPKREDIDPVEVEHLKADKMRKDLTAQLLQKDSEIQELKQKYEEIVERHSAEIQQLRGELGAEKSKSRELAEMLSAKTEKLEAEKSKSREFAEMLSAKTEKLEAEKSKSRELAEVLSAKNEKLEALQTKILSQKIDHHPNNAHKDYYTLASLTGTSARITRIGEDYKWYNFVNKFEILPNQKAKYSLTINKTARSFIKVGFCTEKGLGNIDNYWQTDTAYYHCQGSGYIWYSGCCKQIGVNILAGETVECVADLESGMLQWWKEGSQIGECQVPFRMRGEPIYISILLCNAGDEIDLCI